MGTFTLDTCDCVEGVKEDLFIENFENFVLQAQPRKLTKISKKASVRCVPVNALQVMYEEDYAREWKVDFGRQQILLHFLPISQALKVTVIHDADGETEEQQNQFCGKSHVLVRLKEGRKSQRLTTEDFDHHSTEITEHSVLFQGLSLDSLHNMTLVMDIAVKKNIFTRWQKLRRYVIPLQDVDVVTGHQIDVSFAESLN